MELMALRTFQAVVEEGGILAASRRLNTVQSNVTARIQRLEEELGTELFYRQGRGLTLAPSGRVLLEYTEKMLRLAQQTHDAVRQVGESSGELRIGTMETFAAVRLPPALKRVRTAHPQLKLHVATHTSALLLEQVLKHKLDCAFVGGSIEHPDLLAQQVLEEELVLVRAASERAERLPLILFREGCAYRARALTWQRECGHPSADVMELGTLEGILGCVAVGLGCTLMPSWVVRQSRYVDALSIDALPAHIACVPTVMVRHRQALPLIALETLASAVIEQPPFTLADQVAVSAV